VKINLKSLPKEENEWSQNMLKETNQIVEQVQLLENEILKIVEEKTQTIK